MTFRIALLRCHPEPQKTARDLAIEVKTFFVYLMTNRTRGVLYTGVTNSLERRIWFHRNNATKSFTKTYKVDRLVYYEQFNEARYAIAKSRDGAVRRKTIWCGR